MPGPGPGRGTGSGIRVNTGIEYIDPILRGPADTSIYRRYLVMRREVREVSHRGLTSHAQIHQNEEKMKKYNLEEIHIQDHQDLQRNCLV